MPVMTKDEHIMLDALISARPFIYSVMHEAREEGQKWREETAQRVLAEVDRAIAIAGIVKVESK